MPKSVAVIVGSLRRAAFSRRLAKALIGVAPPGLTAEIVEISDLVLFNQDFEADKTTPPAYEAFRAAILAHDAVLFVTPEYNRSMPAALKNAVDVGSRPYGQSVWTGKPAAIASCSPGATGGVAANLALRQALIFPALALMSVPELYVGGVDKLVGEDGAIQNDDTKTLFTKFMAAFAEWIDHNAR